MEERARIKPSTQFACALVAFAVGVALSELIRPSLWIVGTLLLIAGVFLFFLCHAEQGVASRKQFRIRFFIVLLVAFLFGGIRLLLATPLADGNNIISWNGQTVELVGRVAAVRVDGYRTRIVVVAKTPGEGRVWATVRDFSGVVGDRVTMRCELKAPTITSDFNFPGWLASQRIFSVCDHPKIIKSDPPSRFDIISKIAAMRARLITQVTRVVPEPSASLAVAFLIGEERGLPQSMIVDFRRAGLSHVLAVSGYQVTLLTSIFAWILLALTVPRWARAIAVVCFLGVFIILSELQAGVVRAAIMSGMGVLATQFGRRSHTRNALLAAGAGMVLLNPFILLHDISFQLSFAATWGLVDLDPRLRALAPRLFGWMGEGSQTVAAIIAVTPLALLHFGRFALYAPIANLMTLPLVAVFTLLSIPLVLLSMIWPSAAAIFGSGMNIIAEALSVTAHAFAHFPYAQINMPVWVGVALLVAVVFALPRRTLLKSLVSGSMPSK
ncbi:MAG: ComEC/Rec2 family competence protein [bacterium]|nr:ComEC/Rec2 family competence protein [bacterium]